MPRKGAVPKRDVLPDPAYNSKTVTRFINKIMLSGKKSVAQGIVYEAFEAMGAKTGNLQSAIYQAYMKESSQEGKSALYRISWNVTKAPHGRLLEHGWIQRYKVYMGKNGKWYTLKKSPLPEPIQHPGKAFIRRAGAAEGEAIDAMKAELQKRLDGLYYGGA